MNSKKQLSTSVNDHVIVIKQYFLDLFIRVVIKDLVGEKLLSFGEKLVLLNVVISTHLISDKNGSLKNVYFSGHFWVLDSEQRELFIMRVLNNTERMLQKVKVVVVDCDIDEISVRYVECLEYVIVFNGKLKTVIGDFV